MLPFVAFLWVMWVIPVSVVHAELRARCSDAPWCGGQLTLSQQRGVWQGSGRGLVTRLVARLAFALSRRGCCCGFLLLYVRDGLWPRQTPTAGHYSRMLAVSGLLVLMLMYGWPLPASLKYLAHTRSLILGEATLWNL